VNLVNDPLGFGERDTRERSVRRESRIWRDDAGITSVAGDCKLFGHPERARSLVLKKTADTTVVVATISFTVADNLDYTVYATGGTGGAPVTTSSRPTRTRFQQRARWKCVIVNMSPSAGAVDVFVTAPNADLSRRLLRGRPRLPECLALRVFSPGTYQVRASPAGTLPPPRTSVVLTLNNVALAGVQAAL